MILVGGFLGIMIVIAILGSILNPGSLLIYSQSSPAGVYTYSRASGLYSQNLGGADLGVTFTLDLRSDSTFVSTVESGIAGHGMAYMAGRGDIPSGSGTWHVRDGSVILSSGGRQVARLRIEGSDLIHADRIRYTRIQ